VDTVGLCDDSTDASDAASRADPRVVGSIARRSKYEGIEWVMSCGALTPKYRSVQTADRDPARVVASVFQS